jgi:hypothetical protein
MGIICYPVSFLHMLQNITLTTLKQSMRIPSNMDCKPFFMPVHNGSRGLVSLVDLQATITCASTFHTLNSGSLSRLTTTTTWTHTYNLPGSNVSSWTAALKEIGLTAWRKLQDINLIGHTVDNPGLALKLVHQGVTKWSQLTRQGKLMDKTTLEHTISVPLTYNGYHNIHKAACIPNTLTVN